MPGYFSTQQIQDFKVDILARFNKLPPSYAHHRSLKTAQQEQALIRSPKGLYEILVGTQYLLGDSVQAEYNLEQKQKKILAEKIISPVYDLFRQIEKNKVLGISDLEKIDHLILGLDIDQQKPPLDIFFKGVKKELEKIKRKIQFQSNKNKKKRTKRTINHARFVENHGGKFVVGLNQRALAAMGNHGGLCQGFSAWFLENFRPDKQGKTWQKSTSTQRKARLSHLTKPNDLNNALSLSLEVALKYSMQPKEDHISDAIVSKRKQQADFLKDLFKKTHAKTDPPELSLIHIGNQKKAHALAVVREGGKIHFQDSERLYCTFDDEAKFKVFLKDYLDQHYKNLNQFYTVFDYDVLAQKVLTLKHDTPAQRRAKARAAAKTMQNAKPQDQGDHQEHLFPAHINTSHVSKTQWKKFQTYMKRFPNENYKASYSADQKSIGVQFLDSDQKTIDQAVEGLKEAGCNWVNLETTEPKMLCNLLRASQKHFKFENIHLGPKAEKLIQSLGKKGKIDPVVQAYLQARKQSKPKKKLN